MPGRGTVKKEIYSIEERPLIGLERRGESFEKCSILFKVKEDENFNYSNTFSILRIKIRV